MSRLVQNLFRRLVFGFRIITKSKLYDYTLSCPFCQSYKTKILQHKYWILQLKQCDNCGLMFRFPKDAIQSSLSFYNDSYSQDDDLTTNIPNPEKLKQLKCNNFKGSGKDFSERIEMLKRLTKCKGKLLEFGSSWGYFLYQASNNGFNCSGIEVSKRRAEFGIKNLNVSIATEYESVPDASIDVIYSCHVIEHIADLSKAFNFFVRVLRKNGLLVIECPNCSSDYAKNQGVYWGPMIGEVHVNAITAEFLEKALKSYGFNVKMITRLEEITDLESFLSKSQENCNLQGDNLIAIAQKF